VALRQAARHAFDLAARGSGLESSALGLAAASEGPAEPDPRAVPNRRPTIDRVMAPTQK